ncbi:MAG: TIR domain-containing protein, partial [Anaerolineae bacterium]|nr:TIR domain-containing protein [Anaerolineae bacterium]
MSHIFISYSKKDIEFARYLRDLLEAEGYGVWMDETRLVPSEQWWPTIERNIETCAAFIVIMSPNSRVSRWVEREILYAESDELHKPIFPVLLKGRVWPRLADIQYSDMKSGLGAALPPLLINGLRRAKVPVGERAIVPPPLPGDPISGVVPLPSQPTNRRTIYTISAVIALIVVAAVVIGLIALSGGDDDNPTPSATQGASVPTDTPEPAITTPAPTDTAEPTQTQTPSD